MALKTDIALKQDAEGIYDIQVDPVTGDFVMTEGLESALLVALFSDRRAADDEVRDPLRRRGWDGDLVADVPDDRFGSGLWLYEQARLDAATRAGVRTEAEAALDWMTQESLAASVAAVVEATPASRALQIAITINQPDGGVISRAYALADATQTGALVEL